MAFALCVQLKDSSLKLYFLAVELLFAFELLLCIHGFICSW